MFQRIHLLARVELLLEECSNFGLIYMSKICEPNIWGDHIYRFYMLYNFLGLSREPKGEYFLC